MYKVLLTIFFLLTLSVHAAEKPLNNAQLEKLMHKGIKVIDIRTQKEWKNTGIIPGAYTITYKNKKAIAAWLRIFNRIIKNTSTSFVLVSHNDAKATQLAKVLSKEYGYKNSFHLSNGIRGWISSDRKVVKTK